MRKVICGLCGGEGKNLIGVGVRTCTSCKGTGKIVIPDNFSKCKKCKGTGKIGWRKCATCEAKGWMKRG